MSLHLYNIPARICGLIFDIDKTLYSNDFYADNQIQVLIERLAEEKQQTVEDTLAAIAETRKTYAEKNNGSTQSLGNIFLELGIPIETSVHWREELIDPKKYLAPDPVLQNVFIQLADNFRIIAVTNNPVKTGRETLQTLGVLPFFRAVLGLDSMMKSKPDPDLFLNAAYTVDCSPGEMISIGDRYDVDIAPALSAGMGGILIDNVEDLAMLQETLKNRNEVQNGTRIIK